MKQFICIFLLLKVSVSFGQYSIGKKDSLYSKVLKEQRALRVYVPESAKGDSKQQFPVIYLLDGETYFHSFTGEVSHLSEINGNAVIPDMIVVGIVNTTRSRDLSPTRDSLSNVQPNGGGEQFTRFIETELFPYINTHYPVAPYRMLVGHSLGGLFTVNTLLKHTGLFNSYLAIDPAFDWDKKKLLIESESQLLSTSFKNKSLFLGGSSLCIESNSAFESLLKKMDTNGLIWQSKYYNDESHGSVPLISSYDGLKFLFSFYKRPSFVTITDSSIKILAAHYEMVSTKMGYTIHPPENLLLGLAWRCRVLEKNYDKAYPFLHLAETCYPTSVEVNTALADLYTDKGDTLNANHYRVKAVKLSNRK
jgi:predicted alpha/beta superfamily hydrolase